MVTTRDDVITNAFQKGRSIDHTNRMLFGAGMRGLDRREEALYRTGNWGTNVFERIGKDAKEFVQGVNTITTLGSDALGKLKENPGKTVYDAGQAIYNYGKDKGIGGAIGDVYNLITSPYGITTKDIAQKGMDAFKDLPANMWAHPGYTTVDVLLPAMGKAIPTHAVGNVIAKSKAVPQIVKDFIPSSEISKVNQVINSSHGIVNTADRAFALEVNRAVNSGKGNLTQAVKNLEIPQGGRWVGDKDTIQLTKNLAKISDQYNQGLIEMGTLPDAGKNIATAQYVFETINPTRAKKIAVQDVVDAINGDTQALRSIGLSRDQLSSLANEGRRLYDQGLIRPLSHRATYKSDKRLPGLVTDTDRMLGAMADRRYGFATPRELASTLGRAYEGASRELRDARLGTMSFEKVLQEVGEKVNPQTLERMRLGDNDIVLSGRELRDVIGADFRNNNFTSIGRRINNRLDKGLAKNEWGKYANDLYVIDRDNLRPLRNVFDQPKGWWGRKLNSLWKTAMLITPKYFLENRLGNSTLNAIEGVTLKDYIDASILGRYNKIRPERLKADTSYYGVLGEDFRGTAATQAMKQSLNTIKSGAVELSPKKFIKGTYDLFSAPVLGAESQFEALDRYANFIRQAKRLSQRTGKSVESIIKRSSQDVKLYDKLMMDVNKSLGDYIGRNWAINPNLYEGLSFMFPFFKYPTQGLRTLTHQAMTKPLDFALKATLPQRIGYNRWQEEVKKYPEIADQWGGIVTDRIRGKGGYTTLKQQDINPLGAGAGILSKALSDWKEININPIAELWKVFQFKDAYGNMAGTPWYKNSYGKGPTFIRDKKGRVTNIVAKKPTIGDYLSLAGATGSNLFYPPVRAWNSYIGPFASGMSQYTNNPIFWYPRYNATMMGQLGDTYLPRPIQPFVSGKIEEPGVTGNRALAQMLGVRRIKVIPGQSKKTINNAFKQVKRTEGRKKATKKREEQKQLKDIMKGRNK